MSRQQICSRAGTELESCKRIDGKPNAFCSNAGKILNGCKNPNRQRRPKRTVENQLTILGPNLDRITFTNGESSISVTRTDVIENNILSESEIESAISDEGVIEITTGDMTLITENVENFENLAETYGYAPGVNPALINQSIYYEPPLPYDNTKQPPSPLIVVPYQQPRPVTPGVVRRIRIPVKFFIPDDPRQNPEIEITFSDEYEETDPLFPPIISPVDFSDPFGLDEFEEMEYILSRVPSKRPYDYEDYPGQVKRPYQPPRLPQRPEPKPEYTGPRPYVPKKRPRRRRPFRSLYPEPPIRIIDDIQEEAPYIEEIPAPFPYDDYDTEPIPDDYVPYEPELWPPPRPPLDKRKGDDIGWTGPNKRPNGRFPWAPV